jgi:S-adenosylmethionine decarboxylase proenzyme, Bacillus form
MIKQTRTREVQSQIRKILGKHVYGNMYGLSEAQITNIDFLTKTVLGSAKVGNMHIIELVTKKFPGYNGIEGGVSIIALIEESHIALHTWPESSYATVDIYSCGDHSRPELAYKHILERLTPKKHKFFSADRGNMTVS